MLRLYQLDQCPSCARVRDLLLELDLACELVEIDPADRSEVERLSGQPWVPLLVDTAADVVLPESTDIIAYLRARYA